MRTRAALALTAVAAVTVVVATAATPALAAVAETAAAGPGLPASYVYVADNANSRIMRYDAAGAAEVAWSGNVRPSGVVADAAGNVYLTAWGSGSVIKVGATGSETTIGSGLLSASDLAVDAAGDVYVADPYHGRVVEFRADGSNADIGTGLDFPEGVAVTAAGDVYIADSGSGSVVVVAADGTQSTIDTGVSEPAAIAVGAEGTLYVADGADGRIVAVPEGGAAATFATGFTKVTGVAVDAAGTVYVTDSTANSLVSIAAGGARSTVSGDLSSPQGVGVAPSVKPAFTRASPPASTIAGAEFLYGFSATGLPAPQYSVSGQPAGLSIDPTSGVLSGTPDTPGRSTFTVSATNSGGRTDVSVTLSVVAVGRVSGSDRFQTAIQVSKAAFPGTAPVVYLASGTGFADALSAGPAAAKAGGPVLLTAPGTISDGVLAEIGRLQAQHVVVVGGVNAVSASVFDAVKKQVPDTSRIAGSDRFETSRLVAGKAFSTGATSAYVATGLNFPDALAAGAAGGGTQPVLLVNGAASTVDGATLKTLSDLGTTAVTVAGGPNVVSPGFVSGLNGHVPTTRRSGDDRYATARAINEAAFSTAGAVLIATGTNFPDALAGTAMAPTLTAPLYTVPGTCIPQATLADIESLGATQVTLLGGPASLTDGVATLTPCY